jgi:hypothetical protein
MIFQSKRDIWMGVIVWILIATFSWIFYQSVFIQFDILGILIMSIMIFFLCSIWFNTRYNVYKNTLKIIYGPISKSINIMDIHSIRHTRNPFIAPALSMDRIEINYGKYETISISPKDKKAFLAELQTANPKFLLNNKLKRGLLK